MSDYDSYTKDDWKKLNGDDWYYLLREQPQFAKHCDWEKLDGVDWYCLLIKQPQFAKHCDWEKLDKSDWNYLYKHQFQLRQFISENKDAYLMMRNI